MSSWTRWARMAQSYRGRRVHLSMVQADRATAGEGPRARPARLLLASRSPRRRLLLIQNGIEHEAAHPGVDDGTLEQGQVSPEAWAAALAYFKAAAGADQAM